MRRITKSLQLIALAMVMLILPATAHAGSYWWTGAPAAGSNGFSWQQTGGWNPWGGGSRCENSATTYGTGSYCQLVWSVPANLDPVSGSIQGSYRQANSNFEQQMFVEGNGTTVVQGDTNTRTYNRQWSDMASYLYIRVINTGAPTTTSAGTVWFDSSSMSINLVDPYSPGLNILEGHGGWKGVSGACIRYGYADAGSGLDATSLSNVNTGAVYDNPGYQTSAITTGVFQNDRNCVGVPAPGTGTYSLRAAAVDKSGNYVQNDFAVSFDTTAPTVSAPSSGGAPIANGAEFTSSSGYRPTFTWSIGDAHSGVASITAKIDGTAVAHSYSGGVVTMTPPARLALGTRSIAITVTDAVGNATTVNRTIVVRDDALPTIAVAAPVADGSNSPTLDVTAADDYSGVETASWRVAVNGVQLPVTLGTSRVQADIGRLANGTHQIEIRVKDVAGNERVHALTYIASSDEVTPPGLDGIYVMSSPQHADQGDDYRVFAIAVKSGRPIGTGRLEISKVGGDGAVLAGKIVNPDGTGDLLITISVPGPLQIALPGSGLAPATFDYTYRTPADPGYCVVHPQHPACQTTSDGGNGGTSGTGGDGGGTGGGTSTTGTGTGTVGGTTGGGNTSGTSGGPTDHVAPVFRSSLVRTRPGQVLRSKVIPIRLASNERSTFTIAPAGSIKTRASFTKAQVKIVKLRVTGALLRRLRAARGRPISVRIVFIAVDGNKNVRRKAVMYRIRG